jgi:ribosomal protein S18 acetylase RimI-like enzyme
MDDGTLRQRLWLGFARLQTLLGGQAAGGVVIERPGVVASIVPAAPESPTLNAAIALAADLDPALLRELHDLYRDAGVRRWGVWTDAGGHRVIEALEAFKLRLSTSSPGMAAAIDELDLDGHAGGVTADLATVGRVNDMAYGNPDSRLERTLAPLAPGPLRGYRADHDGHPASVALALHHDGDCGVSFVATLPQARRRGLATQVMRNVLADAQRHGLDTVTLQATEQGERLYAQLGLHRLGNMELWEHRH